MQTSPAEVATPVGRPPREYFWNWPNTITVGRTPMVPVLVLFPYFSGPPGSHGGGRLSVTAGPADLVINESK